MMDPKIVFMLFLVEAAALIFTIFHLRAPQTHLYNAYDQDPVNCSTTHTSQVYYCFTKVNHCIFNEHNYLLPMHVIHLISIVITVFCYICILIILLLHWEEKKPSCRCYGIKYYRMLQMSIILCLFADLIFIGGTYWLDDLQIHQCAEASRLIRIENMVTYFIIDLLEMVYNIVDMLAHKEKDQQERAQLVNRVNNAEINQTDEDHGTVLVDRRNYNAISSRQTTNNLET